MLWFLHNYRVAVLRLGGVLEVYGGGHEGTSPPEPLADLTYRLKYHTFIQKRDFCWDTIAQELHSGKWMAQSASVSYASTPWSVSVFHAFESMNRIFPHGAKPPLPQPLHCNEAQFSVFRRWSVMFWVALAWAGASLCRSTVLWLRYKQGFSTKRLAQPLRAT